MFYKKNQYQFFSLGTIINGNVNVIFHDSKDVVPPFLPSISQKYSNTLSPLNIPMEEHDNILDKSTIRESIEYEVSVAI